MNIHNRYLLFHVRCLIDRGMNFFIDFFSLYSISSGDSSRIIYSFVLTDMMVGYISSVVVLLGYSIFVLTCAARIAKQRQIIALYIYVYTFKQLAFGTEF